MHTEKDFSKKMTDYGKLENSIWDEIARVSAYREFYERKAKIDYKDDKQLRDDCLLKVSSAKGALIAYNNVLKMIREENEKCQKEENMSSDARETS